MTPNIAAEQTQTLWSFRCEDCPETVDNAPQENIMIIVACHYSYGHHYHIEPAETPAEPLINRPVSITVSEAKKLLVLAKRRVFQDPELRGIIRYLQQQINEHESGQ